MLACLLGSVQGLVCGGWWRWELYKALIEEWAFDKCTLQDGVGVWRYTGLEHLNWFRWLGNGVRRGGGGIPEV